MALVAGSMSTSIAGAAALVVALAACRHSPSDGRSPAPSGPAPAASAARPLLAAPDTFGVVAGVLAFSDPGVVGFSDEQRKDRELFELLERRGVPRDNLTLLLDARATASSIHDAVERVAERAPAGSTLFFYYAGHGARDDAGRPYFLAYDTVGNDHRLFVDDLGRRIRERFRGKRLILMADCCYSGTLQDIADGSKGYEAVVLTSADASNLSTENWTFTQTVIDGLSGDPLADANGDGSVTLGELSEEVARAMKHREAQRHGFYVRGVALSEPLARASARPASAAGAPFAAGEYVRVNDDVARVREAGQNESLVRFYHYSRAEDTRVKNASLVASSFRASPQGSKLRVFWGGKIWDAQVQRLDGDFMLVTYPGWPSYWDEWILSDRVAAETGTALEAGKRVSVEWRGRWYPAIELERAGARSRIHYVGYDSSWDEWVGPGRIRR